MNIKKHLSGGTLHTVMATEIKRAIAKFSGQDQSVEKAALELGITPRTLRVWKGPVEKGGWTELQGFGGMEKLTRVKSKKAKTKKKSTGKKVAKKKASQASEARA